MTSRTSSVRPLTFSAASAALNRVLVGAYKIFGFVILTVILLGISAFVGIHTFYVVHHAWLTPTVISPTDAAVLDLRARIADESWKRHKVEGERVVLQSKLDRARLVAQLEQSFQEGFQSALAGDAVSSRASLTMLAALKQERQNITVELRHVGKALGQSSVEQLEKDFAAKLIDKQELLQGTYQLAQLAQTRLDLQEREVELGDRIRRSTRELDAMDAARLGDASKAGSRMTYEGLLLRREHDRSLAEGVGAQGEVQALERSLSDIDRALSHYDDLLGTLRAAPLLSATEQQLNLAFVPYENQAHMREGAPLYGCRVALLWCRPVGHIKQYVVGEHRQDHPVYGKELRGQLVELELEDAEWAKISVLHGNRAPLLL